MQPDSRDEALSLLLDELEVQAQEQHAGERSEAYWVCKRKHPRSPFRTPCLIYFFPQGSFTVTSLTGRTRNISRSGIGLLVRRVFRTGEPIEVELTPPGRPKTYLGGLVTFCRYAGRGYHEIGVSFRASGREPIFSKNPSAAVDKLPWLRVVGQTF
jgi:hypothetical protein